MHFKLLGSGNGKDLSKYSKRGKSDPQIDEYNEGGKSVRKSTSAYLSHNGESMVLGLGNKDTIDLLKYLPNPEINYLMLSNGDVNKDDYEYFKSLYPNSQTIISSYIRKLPDFIDKAMHDKSLVLNNGLILSSSPSISSSFNPSVVWQISGPVKIAWAPDFYNILKPNHALDGADLAVLDGSSVSRDSKRILSGDQPRSHQAISNSIKMLKNNMVPFGLFVNIGKNKMNHNSLKTMVKDMSWFPDNIGIQCDVGHDEMSMNLDSPYDLCNYFGNLESKNHLPLTNKTTIKSLFSKGIKHIILDKDMSKISHEPVNLVHEKKNYGDIVLGLGRNISPDLAKKMIKDKKAASDINLNKSGNYMSTGLYAHPVKVLAKHMLPKRFESDTKVQLPDFFDNYSTQKNEVEEISIRDLKAIPEISPLVVGKNIYLVPYVLSDDAIENHFMPSDGGLPEELHKHIPLKYYWFNKKDQMEMTNLRNNYIDDIKNNKINMKEQLIYDDYE